MKQHYGTIAITDIGPFEESDQVITAGSYCLSTLSTVPYVTFIGPSGSQKLFSWNELVVIPEGETARVKNSSCHRGDIFINGGYDYNTLPGRVTVPVPVVITGGGEAPFIMTPTFGVDTRRARRAFFTFVNTINFDPGLDATAIITGKILNHSYNTFNEISLLIPPTSGIGFACAAVIPALTAYPMIPLGYGAAATDSTNPHTLLDCGEIYFISTNPDWSALQPTAFYVLEY